MCGSTTNTTTTSPPAQVLQNYSNVTAQAQNVAATPYQPYTGELVAGLNQGQNDAIGELQSGYGTANPYLNSGSSYLNNAASGLGGVQNYLQTAGGLGNISGDQAAQVSALQNAGNFLNSSYNTSGQMAGAYGESAALATPQAFNAGTLQQYMNPYTQNVINSTMANAQQQDAIQAQQLNSGAIGQGAYGGDRAGIAQSSLANQQDLANNQTIAGLENQNYTQALGQYNTGISQQQQDASLLQGVGAGYGSQANIAGQVGQSYASLGSQYGTAGQQQLQQASLYNTLGQTQGQEANAYGTLAGQAGNLGQIAQNTNTAGASAALQGSTLQQQNAQAQDTAAYGQFQNAIQYPFQTTSYLANIDEGLGSNSGSATTSPGASLLSQGLGAATTGLGILGAIGGSGGVSAGFNTVTNGLGSVFGALTSDARAKEDIQPIGKTFDGQTMYRFRYKGDPTVRTGLIAQEVEQHTPQAVGLGLGGLKAVDYDKATAGAAARGHYARGGGLGLIGSGGGNMFRGGNMNGLDVFRGMFADGGTVDDGSGLGSIMFNPASLAGNPAWSSSGLGVAPSSMAQPSNNGLSARGPSMGVMAAPPVAQQPASSPPGLGALASFGSAGGGGNAGLASTDPNQQQNMYMALAAAGLGMMAGTSPQAGVNIGQGGLAGIKEYTALQQQDRENQIARADLAIKQQTSAMQLAQFQRGLQASQALAGLGGATPTSDTIPGSTAAPASMPGASAGLGGIAPSAAGSGGGLGAAQPAAVAPTSSFAPPVAGAPTTGPAAPTASSTSDPDFWSGVPNESNPTWLASQARLATAYGQPDIANKYLTMRDQILAQGTVLRNGQVTPIPGSISSSAAKAGADATATASGKQAGEVQNVYDPDGNPIAVPGTTYQQIVKNGGGVVNGTPVTGAQSAYLKPNVDNYADFTKSAMAFEKDYGSNVYSLNALAHIYQNYQGGRGSEAIADLDGYAQQAGIEGLLPQGWQNSQAGFDAAYKSAVDQSFKQLADSGATRAPATGLREALMTTARPDADSAARFKIITDKLAALNYQHSMIGSIVDSGSPNVLAGMINFQKANSYGDFVNAARSGTPLPTGMNAASSNMVLGPTGGSRPGNGVQPQGQAPPGAAPPSGAPAASPQPSSSPMAVPPASQRAVGQTYMTPKGPAKWMGSGWQPIAAGGQ